MFFFFYVIWYLCVLGASYNFSVIACFISAVCILIHFALSKKKTADLIVLVVFVILGVLLEKVLLGFHIIYYPNFQLSLHITNIPIWILFLYGGFSITINHSMVITKKRPFFSSIVGGIGTSVCYYFTSLRGVIELPMGFYSLFLLAIYWGIWILGISRLQNFLSKRFY